MGLGLLAFRSPRETWADTKKDFWRIMKAGWRVWPLVTCITYTVIPMTHRVSLARLRLNLSRVEIATISALANTFTEAYAATRERGRPQSS